MTINRILAPFRAVQTRLTKPALDEALIVKRGEYDSIRAELQGIRKQLYILERVVTNLSDNELEDVSFQIKSLREREHALIKQAKRLCGERIHIESSLMEYENELLT